MKQRFRKKPTIIEAWQTERQMVVETPEGPLVALPGDWIITEIHEVRDAPYPCTPDIFERTYEAVE